MQNPNRFSPRLHPRHVPTTSLSLRNSRSNPGPRCRAFPFVNPYHPTVRWLPRVQAAGVSSLTEALFCRSVGIRGPAFTLGLPHGPHDGLTPQRARDIIRRLPGDLTPVLVTYLSTAREAGALATSIGAQAVQFHGGISDTESARFRELCPTIATIGRVSVRDTSAVEEAERFDPALWDAIILDSYDPLTGKSGATGRTHDWGIASRIVERVPLPVILAGGLNAENVRKAILSVKPACVDAHTGLENPGGLRNFHKIAAFALEALHAFADLPLRCAKPQ